MLDGPPAPRAISQGDVPFQAHVGIAAGANVTEQAVRFGAPAPLTVTLVSSAPAIGSLVVNGVTAATQQIEIPIGASVSSAAADARPSFRPLASGNTTVTAAIPGYQQVGNAIRTVTVSP